MGFGKRYTVFGLTLDSEIEFPELLKTEQSPQLQILYGNVPESLDPESFKGARFQINKKEFLISIDNVVRIYYKDPKIIVQPLDKVDENSIRAFILGPVLGAILHYKNRLPLHASGILVDGKAVLISGRSGVGKSTLALSFYKQEFALISDDICSIEMIDKNVMLLPGFPQMKQWPASLKIFNENIEEFDLVRPEIEKRNYPAKNFVTKNEIEISQIFFLKSHNKENIEINKLSGIDKFSALKNNTYRKSLIPHTGNIESHFRLCTKVSELIEMYEVKRPDTGCDPRELVDYLKSYFK